MTNETKDVYAVIMCRTDGQHIIVEADDFEKAYTKWATYRDHWEKCLHEKKPFVVVEKETSTVRAFDPTFVYEIIIKKKDLNSKKLDSNNPYYKEMLDKGFSNSFNKNTVSSGADLLDLGYKV